MIFLYLIFVKFNSGKNWKSEEIGPNVTAVDLGGGSVKLKNKNRVDQVYKEIFSCYKCSKAHPLFFVL